MPIPSTGASSESARNRPGILTLGWLEAVAPDGSRVTLGGVLERRVLAVLVTAADTVVTMDVLADAVFAGQLLNGANIRLRNHVFRLRKRLGPDVIVSAGDGYRLDSGSVAIDWQRFDERMSEARSEFEPHRRSAILTEALALWRGPLTSDLEDWAPARQLTGRLIELRKAAEEELAEALLGCGRVTDAVVLLETLTLEEPLRENRWRLLMTALEQTGRHAEALRAYQRAVHELGEVGLDPGPNLRELERALIANELKENPFVAAHGVNLPDKHAATSGRLPRPLTEWFGDTAELKRMSDELLSHHLATLTGPGGVGKTRAAIEIGSLVVDQFPDGMWFVDLATIAAPEHVVAVVSSTLSVGPQPTFTAIESIVDWLGHRRALLIVDNCEHVLRPATALVAAVNASCHSVYILTTSREPLGLAGERVIALHPLEAATAVDLFCDRAKMSDRDFALGPGDGEVIATICERLDRIPLAIELAAARIRSSTPVDLLARLDDRFRLLRGAARGGVERHQTMRSCVAWSHQLLTDADRTVFDSVSVFAGSFDARAAAAVLGDNPLDVVDALSSLVDKSMMIAERRTEGVRYRLPETLRQFGEEQLFGKGETSQMHDHHLDYFDSFAERTHALWSGSAERDADLAFDLEWDNLRAAHQWALVSGDQVRAERLVAKVDPHAQVRMRTEVGDWARRTLDLATPASPAGSRLYGHVAHWTFYGGDHPATVIRLAEDAIAAAPYPEHSDTSLARTFALIAMMSSGQLAGAADAADALRRAVATADEAFICGWGRAALCLAAPAINPASIGIWVEELEHDAERFGSPFIRLGAWYYRSLKLIFVDNPPDRDGAAALCRLGLCLARELDNREQIGQFMLMSVFGTTMAGDVPDAIDLSATIRYFHDTRNWIMMWLALESASVSFARRQMIEAAATLEAFLESGGRLWAGNPPWSAMREAALASISSLDPHLAAACGAEGGAMTREDAVAFAQRILSSSSFSADAEATRPSKFYELRR